MPPLASAEDYVDLLVAIEDTAAHLEMPVVIEGYPPPYDPRLREIKVTPDPGVIEVNVHPAANWHELLSNTAALYEDARQSRLSAEKFMIDGRHTGTGGGNHFVLGGPTPSDSPFLRRPDLLRSSPDAHRRTVVFPAPFGPRRAITEALGTRMVTPRRTSALL